MRPAMHVPLVAAVCLALLSACGSGQSQNPPHTAGGPVGSENPQQAYIEQLSLERQGLGDGSMMVSLPTSGVQNDTGTMTVTVSGSTVSVSTAKAGPSGSVTSTSTSTIVSTPVSVGGMMDVHATCTGVTCSPVSNEPQPVDKGLSGTWTWDLTYGPAGVATVQIVADLYQTSSVTVLWESAPLTETIAIQATSQQKVDRSLSWLHDTIISVSAVAVALAPVATWLYSLRRKRRRRAETDSPPQRDGSRAPRPTASRNGTANRPRWLRNQRRD